MLETSRTVTVRTRKGEDTPAPLKAEPPAKPNDNHVNLVQNIERLKLSVDRILPLHGRMVPLADLYAAIGRKP